MELPCTSAIKCKPVQTCVNQLTIGTISAVSTNVFVRVKNMSTGRIVIYSAQSDNTGLVKIDISATELIEKTTYKVNVNSISQYYDITIDGQTAESVFFPIERVQGGMIDNVTLTAE